MFISHYLYRYPWTANQSDRSHFCFTVLNPSSWCWDTKTHHRGRLCMVSDTQRHPQHLLLPPRLKTNALCIHEDHICAADFVIWGSILIAFRCSSRREAINWRSLVWFFYLSPPMLQNRHSRQKKKQTRSAETCCFCDTVQMLWICCANFFDIYS